jgi:protein gp37
LKVSPGCKACYMYRDQERYGNDPKVVVRASDHTFNSPLRWHRALEDNGPFRVFTCSWSDWFIDQADEWRDDAWEIIRQTPNITYLILTKRPENIRERLPDSWSRSDAWENVWIGVSVESEDYLHRVDTLSLIDAKVRFVSYEPALGPVDFTEHMRAGTIDWLISGGESGAKTGKYVARPHDLDWFRQVKEDCDYYGIPYFHKQHGGTSKIDGEWGGYLLDGIAHHEFPGG